MRSNSEPGHETRSAGCQSLNRGHVQMIVVIVRNDCDIDWEKLAECERRRVRPAGAGPADRRASLAPDRVRKHACTIDLEQNRRVSDPGCAQARSGNNSEITLAQLKNRERRERI